MAIDCCEALADSAGEGWRGLRSNNTQTRKGEQQRWGHTDNLYRETPLWATTTTKEAHSPHGVTPHNSLTQVMIQQGQTNGSHGYIQQGHIHTTIQLVTVTQPVHLTTTRPHTTTDDPTLDTHITRTQNESYIPLAGLNHTTVGNYKLWLHNKVTQQSKKVSHTAKLYIITISKKHCQMGITLCNNTMVSHIGNMRSRVQVYNRETQHKLYPSN